MDAAAVLCGGGPSAQVLHATSPATGTHHHHHAAPTASQAAARPVALILLCVHAGCAGLAALSRHRGQVGRPGRGAGPLPPWATAHCNLSAVLAYLLALHVVPGPGVSVEVGALLAAPLLLLHDPRGPLWPWSLSGEFARG